MQSQIVTTIITGALLAMFTAILAWQGKGRFDALEGRFDARFEAIDRRFDQIERRLDRLESEVSDLRAAFMQLAIAVGGQPRPQTG